MLHVRVLKSLPAIVAVLAVLILILPFCVTLHAADLPKLENQGVRLEVDPSTASARLIDKKTGAGWELGAPRLVAQDKSSLPLRLSGGVTIGGGALT
jgi:hypothetical protein